MEDIQKELHSYIDNFDKGEELKNLTENEVKEWILEEWEELREASVSCGEATSIIMDAHYLWMKLKNENELFVYEELLKLNQKHGDTKVIEFLNNEIENCKR